MVAMDDGATTRPYWNVLARRLSACSVELKARCTMRLYTNAEATIDALLDGQCPLAEERWVDPFSSASLSSPNAARLLARLVPSASASEHWFMNCSSRMLQQQSTRTSRATVLRMRPDPPAADISC